MCCGGGGHLLTSVLEFVHVLRREGGHLLTGVLEFVHVLRRGGSSLDKSIRVCSCVAEGGGHLLTRVFEFVHVLWRGVVISREGD